MTKDLNHTKHRLMSQPSLEQRLSNHPQLFEKIEALVQIIENNDGKNESADIAEQAVRDKLREIGQQALSTWAENEQNKQLNSLFCQQPNLRKHVKKNSIGTVALESLK